MVLQGTVYHIRRIVSLMMPYSSSFAVVQDPVRGCALLDSSGPEVLSVGDGDFECLAAHDMDLTPDGVPVRSRRAGTNREPSCGQLCRAGILAVSSFAWQRHFQAVVSVDLIRSSTCRLIVKSLETA